MLKCLQLTRSAWFSDNNSQHSSTCSTALKDYAYYVPVYCTVYANSTNTCS